VRRYFNWRPITRDTHDLLDGQILARQDDRAITPRSLSPHHGLSSFLHHTTAATCPCHLATSPLGSSCPHPAGAL
jgi:hypothetical protein